MTFSEYYKYYLTLHSKPGTKIAHICGQITTITYIILMISNGWWFGLMASPFIVYPFAWTSHAVIEKNTPAAFKRPIWAKLCDIRMMYEVLTFKLPLCTQYWCEYHFDEKWDRCGQPKRIEDIAKHD